MLVLGEMRENNLSPNDKRSLAEKLMEFGNLVCATLMFSQLLSENKYNNFWAVLGLFILILLYGISIIIMKGR